jgi:hypothetical protein
VLDTSIDAYAAAWRRHEHTTTCAAIADAIRASANFVRRDCWVNRDDCQWDVDRERKGGWAYGS